MNRVLNETEARDLARTRDAQASPYRISHTALGSYCAELVADYAQDAIDDRIVRLAIVAAPATLQEIYGDVSVPGGNRPSLGYSAKYVSSSYFSRGRLVALSVYCGVSYTLRDAPGQAAIELTKATALKLSETLNRVKGAIRQCPKLEQRGGGVYIDDGSDPWLAQYLTTIDEIPATLCATCGEEIYYANEAWRHKSTKRELVLTPDKQVDHVADPDQEGRKV